MTNLPKYKNLLPTLILAACSVYSVVVLFTSEIKIGNTIASYEVFPQHYAGFTAVVLCLASFFFARKFYRYVLVATLLLGTFSVLNFNVNAHVWSVNAGALNVGFQPLSFAVAILTIALNWKKIQKYFPSQPAKFVPPPVSNEQQHLANFNEEVEVYKVKYFTLSAEELQKIIDDKRFRPEAIEAAKILLSERDKVQPQPSKN